MLTPAPAPDPLQRASGAVVAVLGAALALLLVAMVGMVFGNVALRYALNSGITVSEELARWCFVWLTFLGAVIAVHERAHLGSDLLVSRLGTGGRRLCLGASLLLMLFIDALLLAGSWQQMRINASVPAPVTGLPMALVYAAGVVFAVLAALLHLAELARLVTGRLDVDRLLQVQEAEESGRVPPAARDRTRDGP